MLLLACWSARIGGFRFYISIDKVREACWLSFFCALRLRGRFCQLVPLEGSVTIMQGYLHASRIVALSSSLKSRSPPHSLMSAFIVPTMNGRRTLLILSDFTPRGVV